MKRAELLRKAVQRFARTAAEESATVLENALVDVMDTRGHVIARSVRAVVSGVRLSRTRGETVFDVEADASVLLRFSDVRKVPKRGWIIKALLTGYVELAQDLESLSFRVQATDLDLTAGMLRCELEAV